MKLYGDSFDFNFISGNQRCTNAASDSPMYYPRFILEGKILLSRCVQVNKVHANKLAVLHSNLVLFGATFTHIVFCKSSRLVVEVLLSRVRCRCWPSCYKTASCAGCAPTDLWREMTPHAYGGSFLNIAARTAYKSLTNRHPESGCSSIHPCCYWPVATGASTPLFELVVPTARTLSHQKINRK